MSLLNEAGSEINEAGDDAQGGVSDSTSPNWWIDENTPGQGDRPSFLPEKYKSVEAVVKAHAELEKRLGSAPNEYDFSKGENWIEPDYEPFQHMADFAKQHHVPQAVMDKMLETVGLYLDEFKSDPQEEMAKLGDKADERVRVLNNWAKSNLSEKAYAVLSDSMRTADAIEALEEIRTKMLGNQTIVPGNETAVSGSGMTLADYRSELQENYAKYKSDPNFRSKMQKKLEVILASNS